MLDCQTCGPVIHEWSSVKEQPWVAPAHTQMPKLPLAASDRRFVYVIEGDNADVVAADLTSGTIRYPAAAALTAAPTGASGTISYAYGLYAVGRRLYSSARLLADDEDLRAASRETLTLIRTLTLALTLILTLILTLTTLL